MDRADYRKIATRTAFLIHTDIQTGMITLESGKASARIQLMIDTLDVFPSFNQYKFESFLLEEWARFTQESKNRKAAAQRMREAGITD